MLKNLAINLPDGACLEDLKNYQIGLISLLKVAVQSDNIINDGTNTYYCLDLLENITASINKGVEKTKVQS